MEWSVLLIVVEFEANGALATLGAVNDRFPQL